MAPKINLLSRQVISGTTSGSELLNILLQNRHLSRTETANFLTPPFPKNFLNLKPAVKLINQAIRDNKNILIYGDYDVDGITATAILWQSLYSKTKKVYPFVPHRQIDGYGFKADSFVRFQKEKEINFDLLITVDNGIVADKEFRKVKKQFPKLQIIVTDHHLPAENLPDVDAIVHSTEVSGAALSWFLARAFDKNADLGLAALGAVADCLPLTGINRSIVVHGLKELRLNPSPGIKKLIQVSGARQDSLSAYDLGFLLGPRINAVGRLDDPTEALRLLCSQNASQAEKYAQVLNSYNQDRQSLQKESLELADKLVDTSDKIIVINDPSFNPGIIGLIAGRLTEKYYLPSVVMASDDGIAKGSCRSIPEINIIETLRELSDLFIDLGGHALAAGFSIKTENIPKLKAKLTKLVNEKLKEIKLEPTITVDAEMKLSAANLKNYQTIQQLAPFGIGNSEPLFIFKNVMIVSKKVLGQNGDHLKLKLDDPNTPKPEYLAADGIAFKKGNLNDSLNIGDRIDVIAQLSSNTWNNLTTPQLIIKEIIRTS